MGTPPGRRGPPPRGPSGPSHRRRRGKGGWLRRSLIGANIFLLVCLVGAAAGYGYVRYRLGQVRKVDVKGTTAAVAGQPETFLLVGSDSRAGLNAQEFGSTSQVAGQRSDTIILVHLDPASGSASMLSIPRDTYVPIYGTSNTDRINSAFDAGPSQLIQTIHQDFGIQVNHYVSVNFSGLSGLVDTVGGVCMNFPYAVRDGGPNGGNESGLNEPAGNDHLNGTQALSLVRSRYYQYLKDGYYHDEGTGDLGRIIRQHEFLRVLAAKAISSGIHNPITANALVSQAVQDVTVDSGLSSSDMLALISEFHSLSPSAVQSWTLPTNPYVTQAGADVLMPDQTQVPQVISAWESAAAPPAPSSTPAPSSPGTTMATLDPSSVSVKVLNGSGAPSQAAQAAKDLGTVGFTVVSTGDAASFSHTTSVVSYGAGHQAAAQTVASRVEGGAVTHEDPSLSGSAVVLTTGSTYTGISTSAGATTASSGSTTTTAAPAANPTAGANTQSKLPPWDPTPC